MTLKKEFLMYNGDDAMKATESVFFVIAGLVLVSILYFVRKICRCIDKQNKSSSSKKEETDKIHKEVKDKLNLS